ncbi:hypothetical protein [Rufibacter quisquiliarum]|uniref:Energy-converting hydrogenase Eha subunit A n=1 Tax=Rufibacter quisquiliarum TaxID=1549639 RepID=A0A839GZC5_9BACT|nr:hypothetical protein [Rufibacter quisquiliarum]MBA9079021.1 energy-converting hydrogenase Eha subunit A [Rufibacter quisquiliarum]
MMNRNYIYYLTGVVVVMALLLSVIPAEAQCAMCRASVESSSGGPTDTIANGLNKGILYLMAVPYVLIGCVGFFWYRYSKKK